MFMTSPQKNVNRAPILPRSSRFRGFTIIEVMVALVVFTVAVIMSIVMMGNSMQAETAVLDQALAKRVVSTINARLDSLGYSQIQGMSDQSRKEPSIPSTGLLFDRNQDPQDKTLTHDNPKLLYINKLGTKIGTHLDPIWGERGLDADKQKYFEVMLVRGIEPSTSRASTSGENDPILLREAASVQFVVRISWPAHNANGDETSRGTRNAFIFNSALAR